MCRVPCCCHRGRGTEAGDVLVDVGSGATVHIHVADTDVVIGVAVGTVGTLHGTRSQEEV
jgi:hypothetical protein